MISIGIDIAKEKVDIWMKNELKTLKNEERALKEFFSSVKADEMRVVMEATGRYHRTAEQVLRGIGIPVMVINPYQSRNFARSMNVVCKTDKVDAKILSIYGERMAFEERPGLSESEERVRDLTRHIDDLKGTLVAMGLRRKQSSGFEADSLRRIEEALKEEIKKAEAETNVEVKKEEKLVNKQKILTSIPGIGIASANVLIGLMHEMGSLSNNGIAAMAGVAPMNFDSGNMRGKRRIQKGRSDLRRLLYMPVLGAATRCNAVLKRFYEKLIKAGKPTRVAIVACIRKLLVIANTLVKRGEMWDEEKAMAAAEKFGAAAGA